ncbi:hypothetical protein AB0I37_21145 [Micromonospora purpureochromogenes]|uniref:hypothetical protein n=1 Tax=Micromonospora purpureochromogenes TaxID=47872 RepID=UPI003409D961
MATPATDSSVLTRRGVLTPTASSLVLSACGQAQPQDEAEPDGSARRAARSC